jgi:hypothetical protein
MAQGSIDTSVDKPSLLNPPPVQEVVPKNVDITPQLVRALTGSAPTPNTTPVDAAGNPLYKPVAGPAGTPIIAPDTATAERNENFEKYGSGLPSGQPDEIAHYRTYLREHTQAAQLARENALLASEMHNLHNSTQQDVDTAAVLHGLIGKTDPAEIAGVLSGNPHYDVNRVHPVIANLLDRQKAIEAFTSKYGLQQQKIDAKDQLATSLQKAYGVSPEELMFNPAVAGLEPGHPKYTGNGKGFQQLDEAKGGDTIMIRNKSGKPVYIPKQDYYAKKALAIQHYGTETAATPAPAAGSPELQATARGAQVPATAVIHPKPGEVRSGYQFSNDPNANPADPASWTKVK